MFNIFILDDVNKGGIQCVSNEKKRESKKKRICQKSMWFLGCIASDLMYWCCSRVGQIKTTPFLLLQRTKQVQIQ